MEFKDKVAFVTGAGTGNGEAIAERLFVGGASVVLASRRLAPVQSVSKRIDPKGARTLAIEADVRDPTAMESGKESTDWMASIHPMKRLATREEVADLVAYLLSDHAAFITGSIHSIDGGHTAQ